jgi:hypothetical protein
MDSTRRKGNTMKKTAEEKNKRLVLGAFDTLFNKRDYAAAERFCSPRYIQHRAHIAPGREGLFKELDCCSETWELFPSGSLCGTWAIASGWPTGGPFDPLLSGAGFPLQVARNTSSARLRLFQVVEGRGEARALGFFDA